jgi:signal transduction histidine kinase
MYSIETSIYTAVLITGFVIGGLLIYFGITISRKQKKHFKMLSEHFLAEMERLEQERIRIARDLHDELGPILSVTQIHIDATSPDNAKDLSHLQKARDNIQILLERFGGIAHNLTPKVLITKGLNTALSDFFEQYREVTKIKFDYVYKVTAKIEANTALQIYRLIQEMSHNAVKHSGATEIGVLLLERKRKLYIQCKDNGTGMILGQHKNDEKGLGLESLRSRTEMLGGKIQVSSILKAGTEYFLEIPLKGKNEKNNENSNSR